MVDNSTYGIKEVYGIMFSPEHPFIKIIKGMVGGYSGDGVYINVHNDTEDGSTYRYVCSQKLIFNTKKEALQVINAACNEWLLEIMDMIQNSSDVPFQEGLIELQKKLLISQSDVFHEMLENL